MSTTEVNITGAIPRFEPPVELARTETQKLLNALKEIGFTVRRL